VHPELRRKFNAEFTPEKYAALLRCVNQATKWPSDFRISETPVFLTREFTDEAVYAANEIAAQTLTPEFRKHSSSAIPPGLEVPNESRHPEFLIVDLAVCEEGHRLTPRLIEMQAFPSLFAFQFLLLGCMRRAYPAIPSNWTSSFGGIRDEQYIDMLRRTILGESKPENVILLEIEPEKQKTHLQPRDIRRAGAPAAIEIGLQFSGRARCRVDCASELVLQDQQTLVAIHQNGTHVTRVFRG
jgi:hypothetical protein